MFKPPSAQQNFRVRSFTAQILCIVLVSLLSIQNLNAARAAEISSQSNIGTVTVLVDENHPANRFIPSQTLGAGIDGHEKGEVQKMLAPANVKEMLSAGLKPLTYRLRTELGVEAWHWNPKGRWSDAARAQGYWTSDAESDAGITLSYGYRLPHRGNTIDQANDDGFSRIDDGDTSTFWKSNPYLDEHFTGEANALHPQWLAVDLGARRQINAIRILWGAPFAARFAVEYSEGADDPQDKTLPAVWREFPHGAVERGTGGDMLLRLSRAPVAARFVRVLMRESSGASDSRSNDVRERLGYAVREIYVGQLDAAGRFEDFVRHARARQTQSVIYTSSNDPWHRASDMDARVEQPGFDLLLKSGLANNQPLLVPVSLLYGTPEDAAAEIRYLKARGFKIERVEMGEEPEDQFVAPEDYGALYIQWADALHKVDPRLQLGGPCFDSLEAEEDDPNTLSKQRWLKRFVEYLRAHRRIEDFNFFSFEWYPFDNVCDPVEPQLLEHPQLMREAIEKARAVLPPDTPMLITEYGYSAFASEAEVSIEGALLNAEIVALFLTLGGERAYLYGYEPNYLIQELPCAWGNNMMFLTNDAGRIRARLATFYSSWMLTHLWAQPADQSLEIYPASSDILNDEEENIVTAYALRRPDKSWSLLLINKDPSRGFDVQIRFKDAASQSVSTLNSSIELFQFSRAQYAWRSNGEKGYPTRSRMPARETLPPRAPQIIRLAPASLSVVREKN
jgi:hypothetical protein